MTARRWTGPLFVLPAFLVLVMLVFYPLVSTAMLSVTDADGAYVGLDNFRTMLSASVTMTAFWNTLVYVGASIVLQMALGLAAGILLNQQFLGRAVARSALLIPWVVPGIVAATTWAWMFHTEFGIINYMMTATGLIDQPRGWLTNPQTVMPALVVVNVWKMFPFVAVMILAGLQSIPETLYEAARVDGATFRDEVRFIMIPQLRPVILSVSLLLLIWGLNAITLIYAMTKGGPANRSLITPIQIFRQAFEFFQFNQAAALSVVFFLVTLVVIALYLRLTATAEEAA
jgi:multiple sugar transport system permease protein